jgi:DNA-directed RNA polymerase specialized sigma24 family protein
LEREVVHLAWYMGADQRTIADVAGCSERTVRNRWLAARASLKAALDDHPPG